MLAIFGFTITGICFAIFAYTFKSRVLSKTNLKIDSFTYAYYALAAALLTWGIASAIGDATILKNSVLIGDGFLLLGTTFMINVWLGKRNRVWTVLALVEAIVLLYVRASHYVPAPYLRNGILIFNTQEAVAIAISALFVLVWLPVNVRIAKLVSHSIGHDNIAAVYSYMYASATVAALVFLAAKKTITVVLSFLALGLCFAMLIGSNMLIEKMTGSHHGKRSEPAAR